MIKKYGLSITWAIALGATLASLYFSEVAQIDLCSVSWFQRICLYPLALITGRAAWFGFYGITSYVLPLSLLGLGFAAFQIIVQETHWLGAIPACGIKEGIGLGPVSIPMLTFLAFLAINTLLFMIWRISKKESYENQ